MRTLSLLDGHTVTYFISAHEITAGRYAEFQYYQTQDAGIGSDSAAVEQHFASLSARLAAAQEDPTQLVLAADELALLHYNFQFMRTRFHPKHLSFGVLIQAVDGQPATDLSEVGLTDLLARLSIYGLTQGQLEDGLEEFVKKKVRS